MTEPVVNAPGYAAVPLPDGPFDPFRVITWAPFIDQDDARMITFDLRCELESAFDVHPYSAQCRQAVVRSLLLWATLSRTQRAAYPWNGETNVQLGQNLVQHLLDLTAELSGVNSDVIHAELQADRHPFLKKMHEMLRAQGRPDGEWRGRSDRIVSDRTISEAPRSTTYAISPAPQREPSTRAPLRAPTVMAESLARDDVPTRPAGPPAVAVPAPAAVDGAPIDAPAAMKAEPPTPVPAVEQPPVAGPVKEAKPAAAPFRPPPPSFEVAVQERMSNGHAGSPPPPPPSQRTASTAQSPAAGVTRESLVRKVVPPPPPTAAVKAAPIPPAAVKTKPPSAKAPPPPPPFKKTPASPPPPFKKTLVAPPPPPVVVQPKRDYTYSDSDESSTPAQEAAHPAPAAAPPRTAPPPSNGANGSANGTTTASSAGVVGEAELLRYGEGGPEDLLQECLADVAADADGVSAWFDRKLAVTAKDRSVPLSVEAPAAMSLEKAQARMEPRVAKRVERLVQHLCAAAPLELLPHSEASAFLSISDVDQLAAANLLRPAPKSDEPDTVLAFSVIDRAAATPSRRFLSWPCGSNRKALDDGYEPHVPLHHISSYLDAVNAAAGCAESLLSCFDQVELPRKVQEHFVFTDAANRRWCLTRLPMAHTVAAEMVQILLSTLCGHPSYTLQRFAMPSEVRADIWVRTVRFYGPLAAVAQAREKLRAACTDCGATLEPRAADASSGYDFVGVHYDHGSHNVSVEPEMVRRIAAPRQSVTTRDLERQYTQLLFSASVLGIAVSKFYKLLRTVCWRLSEALENPDTLLKAEGLSADAYAQLERWHKSVVRNVPRAIKAESLPSMTLLVELCSESWFSVLIGEESQETWNTGGSLEDVLGTKVACAAITKAVECFQPCIEKGAHVKMEILGGNVLGRNDKPIYRNEPKEVIEDCIRTHLVTRTFSFEVEYIGLNEGKTNGAAAPSKAPKRSKWA